MSQNNGHNSTSLRLKTGLAEMLKGGVIMDVTTAKQAEIAERAGAVAVMALERVPAQIRAEGGVARMASPKIILERKCVERYLNKYSITCASMRSIRSSSLVLGRPTTLFTGLPAALIAMRSNRLRLTCRRSAFPNLLPCLFEPL